jgi:hypothetical protein
VKGEEIDFEGMPVSMDLDQVQLMRKWRVVRHFEDGGGQRIDIHGVVLDYGVVLGVLDDISHSI